MSIRKDGRSTWPTGCLKPLGRQGLRPGRAALPVLALSLVLAGGLLGCSPYPDEDEFLAGVVFNGSFLAGVKSLGPVPAAVSFRGQDAYGLYITGGNSTTAVTATAPATSPLWTDAGKRDPLDPAKTAGVVYVFDSPRSCSPVEGAAAYDPAFDIVDGFTQYPVFADLPEVLSTSAGRAGRASNYSAIVEVVHLAVPAGSRCQAFKRADNIKARIDSKEWAAIGGAKEYRLLQIIDTAATIPPMPYQLGWFGQLVVPYLDMGPVPVGMNGKFVTMPIYTVAQTDTMGNNPMTVARVVPALSDDAPAGVPAYSPVCQDYNVRFSDPALRPPADASDPAYAKAVAVATLSACLVCRATIDGENYVCPFAKSGGGAR